MSAPSAIAIAASTNRLRRCWSGGSGRFRIAVEIVITLTRHAENATTASVSSAPIANATNRLRAVTAYSTWKPASSFADPNALEHDRYDIVTIAAVAGDVPTLRVALELGASPKNVTSRYDGTALIAAAHLGHAEVVRTLIRAGAPLDHVNNLGWTALIESIVLGDGGARHTDTLRALVEAGADVNRPDRTGRTPLALARSRGYDGMARILEQRGAR